MSSSCKATRSQCPSEPRRAKTIAGGKHKQSRGIRNCKDHKQIRKGRKQSLDTRSRKGRKQIREGRKQKREGRKQKRGKRKRDEGRKQDRPRRCYKKLRVLNVQRPWARLLLAGNKKVEVRKYPLKNYAREELWLLETKGNDAPLDFISKIIGIIRFSKDFEYKDLEDFRADESRHCIQKGSRFDWRPAETRSLYGWVVANATLLIHPLPAPKVKGMIGAKATKSRMTLPAQ